MQNQKRRAVWRAMAGAATVPLVVGLVACSGGPDAGGEFSAERKTVDAFMNALQNGDAQQASTYLADRSSFPADALTDDFYSSAVERPQDARISVATENQGTVYVQVDYRLGSDDRELDLVMAGGDRPLIAGWSGTPTILRSAAGAGRVTVSDTLEIEVGTAASYTSLLPGRYSVSYTGAGSAVGPFELDFPVTAPESDTPLPTGVSFAGGALEFAG
ncbi:hypothetical protein [Microbacterium hydrothermale]|uniref:hypothetical protein n=1 Tax=Microbacterium hydrothermale TaxID=857427 RepID=UPI00142DC5EE|nr:hypothetical protein [Microbacterium hydrothermale]